MSLINCPKCGKQISDKSKYCVGCKYPINAKIYECKECGGRSAVKFSVCPNCGCKRKDKTKVLLIALSTLFALLLCAFLCYEFVIVRHMKTGSSSMENTIEDGEWIRCNTLSYAFEEPGRFDIIVFKCPDDEEKNYVKRIIGLPGEKVTLKEGRVYINDSDEPLDEPYLKEAPDGRGDGVYEVPEGRYFVLGDNRSNSADSRVWDDKYIRKDKILGKVE